VNGTFSAMGSAGYGSISANGRYVAFTGYEPDLVANDNNGDGDIFVRDLQTGTTELASINVAGTASGNDISYVNLNHIISDDGRRVVFLSAATDLVNLPDTNGSPDVFVRDLDQDVTYLASVNASGTAAGNGYSGGNLTEISNDGSTALFGSTSTNLTANDTNTYQDIFVRSLTAGTTALASVTPDGLHSGDKGSTAFNGFYGRMVSADGRTVTFHSQATDLAPVDTNEAYDVFAWQAPSITAPRSITGRIVDGSGAPLSGVAVTLSGNNLPAVRTTTDNSGNYSFSNVTTGDYTLTPVRSGYGFAPATRSITVYGSDLANQNFIGYNFTLSGRIAFSNGTGIGNVQVRLNSGQNVLTNGAGYYTLAGVLKGS
jgi:hypothetical protein